MKTWLTVAEGADYAGVSRDTIYTACERGELHHARIGGRRSIRIKAQWIDAWLELRRHDPDGDEFGPEAYVFGNEVGERLKNYQKAWSTLRLRALGHGPHWGPNGRCLPCCRQQIAKMKLHMHDLRREAGSRLLERGADLHTVQLFLDHANISTSSRYLKPSKLALQTTIQRIDAQRRESGESKNGSLIWRNCGKLGAAATKAATSW